MFNHRLLFVRFVDETSADALRRCQPANRQELLRSGARALGIAFTFIHAVGKDIGSLQLTLRVDLDAQHVTCQSAGGLMLTPEKSVRGCDKAVSGGGRAQVAGQLRGIRDKTFRA